jgi:hypothetical protein
MSLWDIPLPVNDVPEGENARGPKRRRVLGHDDDEPSYRMVSNILRRMGFGDGHRALLEYDPVHYSGMTYYDHFVHPKRVKPHPVEIFRRVSALFRKEGNPSSFDVAAIELRPPIDSTSNYAIKWAVAEQFRTQFRQLWDQPVFRAGARSNARSTGISRGAGTSTSGSTGSA